MSVEKISEEQKTRADATEESSKQADKQDQAQEEQAEDEKSAAEKACEQKAEELVNDFKQFTGIGTSGGLVEKIKTVTSDMIQRNIDAGTPAFNLQAEFSQFTQLLEPFKNAMSMLKNALGNIPGVGELLMLVSILQSQITKTPQSQSDNSLLPELTQRMKDSLDKAEQNVLSFVRQLPYLFILLILMMISKIFELIKQIFEALEMKLLDVFPLNLIGDAIATAKSVKQFVTNAPQQIRDMSEQIVKTNLKAATDAVKPVTDLVSAGEEKKKIEEAETLTDAEKEAVKSEPTIGDRIVAFFTGTVSDIDTNQQLAEGAPVIETVVPFDSAPREEASAVAAADTTSAMKTKGLPTNVVKV